jgi:hypothetical protein
MSDRLLQDPDIFGLTEIGSGMEESTVGTMDTGPWAGPDATGIEVFGNRMAAAGDGIVEVGNEISWIPGWRYFS